MLPFFQSNSNLQLEDCCRQLKFLFFMKILWLFMLIKLLILLINLIKFHLQLRDLYEKCLLLLFELHFKYIFHVFFVLLLAFILKLKSSRISHCINSEIFIVKRILPHHQELMVFYFFKLFQKDYFFIQSYLYF